MAGVQVVEQDVMGEQRLAGLTLRSEHFREGLQLDPSHNDTHIRAEALQKEVLQLHSVRMI